MDTDTTDFLAQLLKQLEEGKVQKVADEIQQYLHNQGYFTRQIKVGGSSKHG